MTRRRSVLAALAAGAVLAVPALAQNGARLRTVYVSSSARSLPNTSFVRARDCVRRPRTCVNGLGGSEIVYLVKGKPPIRGTLATVLTDTSCAPDGNGISHCLNILRLASGRRVIVRHDHSMMNDPCLSPGERVRVRLLRV